MYQSLTEMQASGLECTVDRFKTTRDISLNGIMKGVLYGEGSVNKDTALKDTSRFVHFIIIFF